MSQWPTVPLREVLAERQEQPHDAAILDGSCRIVSKISFDSGTLHFRNDPETKTGMILIKPGDLVVSGINAYKGAVALYEGEPDVCATIHYGSYIVRHDRAVPHFIWRLLRSRRFQELLAEHVPGGIKTELKAKRLLPIPIPLPPLPEQRRLVERIDALAAKIEKAKDLRLQAERESAILAFAPFRVLPFPDLDRTYDMLFDYITSHDSGWSPQCEETPASEGEWGVLKTTCVQWHGFQEQQNKALMPGMKPKPDITVVNDDVLLTRAGPVNRVGIACKVPNTYSNLMLSDKIVRLRTKATLLPDYLVAYFAAPFAQDYFRQGKTGLAESQVNISREKLLRLPICVPPLAEQHRLLNWIASIREKAISLASTQQRISPEIDALLPAILDRAFRGEL